MQSLGQKGFTLPEVLIALLIFSVVAAASAWTLKIGVDARDQLAASDARLQAFQLARAVIKDDMAQVARRIARDEFGQPFTAAFEGGPNYARARAVDNEEPLVSFVRRGWANPEFAAPRSTLQRVQYLVIGDRLVRRSWPYVDDARDQPYTDRTLIDGAADIEVFFLQGEVSGELDWVSAWPTTVGGGGGVSMPKAVAIEMETDRYGRLRQLFWLGAGEG